MKVINARVFIRSFNFFLNFFCIKFNFLYPLSDRRFLYQASNFYDWSFHLSVWLVVFRFWLLRFGYQPHTCFKFIYTSTTFFEKIRNVLEFLSSSSRWWRRRRRRWRLSLPYVVSQVVEKFLLWCGLNINFWSFEIWNFVFLLIMVDCCYRL